MALYIDTAVEISTFNVVEEVVHTAVVVFDHTVAVPIHTVSGMTDQTLDEAVIHTAVKEVTQTDVLLVNHILVANHTVNVLA